MLLNVFYQLSDITRLARFVKNVHALSLLRIQTLNIYWNFEFTNPIKNKKKLVIMVTG